MRFGVVARAVPANRAQWRERVRQIAAWGFDVLLLPDHLGALPPLSPLVAAAEVSARLRFGVQVLNVAFWNPVLLAREAAAADVLTDGRLELGFGAGHARSEFEAAGIPYEPAGQRVDRLTAAVPIVRRLLAGDTVTTATGPYALRQAATGIPTIQNPVPLMVGGNGDRILALAAREADIVSLVGFTSGTHHVQTDLSHFTWQGLADRIAHVRAQAGARADDLELSVLVQQVTQTTDRRAAAQELAADAPLDTDDWLDSPFVLLGTTAEIAAQLRRLRDEHGVTYVTTFEPAAEALAPAIAALA